MRKFDKMLNLKKANILAENRYLKSKKINENFTNRTNASVEIEIPYGDDSLTTNFAAYVTVESGEFDYEYGGMRGTHDPGETIDVENITWNQQDFTPEQNKYIESFYQQNNSMIDNKLASDFINSRKYNF